MFKLFHFLCLFVAVHGWKGFFTTEYPDYDLREQTIKIVFTLEAPFDIVKPVPLSLSAVLDTSGSLDGRGISVVKSTTDFLVRKLAEDNGLHDVGVVLYDSTVKELTPVVPVSASNVNLLSALLRSIKAGGKTALSAGLHRGIQQQLSASAGKLRSIYLFSDGLPNVGPTHVDAILSAMDRLLNLANDYISVSTFGVGDAIDVGLLEAIAERGNGDAYVIQHPEDIPLAFGKALGGLKTVVATHLEVIFTTFPGCRIKSVTTGGIYTRSSHKVVYSDLYAGEFRDILFEVDLGVGPVGPRRCLRTEYYYVDPHTGRRLSGDRFTLRVNRQRTAPRIKRPAYRVEESRVKYAVADAGRSARSKLSRGDRRGALKDLLFAKSIAKASVLQDSSTIAAVVHDIDALIGEVKKKGESSTAKIGRIGSFVRVLRKQRSVSVEPGEFKTAEMVETKEQKVTGTEIKDKVLKDVGPQGMQRPVFVFVSFLPDDASEDEDNRKDSSGDAAVVDSGVKDIDEDEEGGETLDSGAEESTSTESEIIPTRTETSDVEEEEEVSTGLFAGEGFFSRRERDRKRTKREEAGEDARSDRDGFRSFGRPRTTGSDRKRRRRSERSPFSIVGRQGETEETSQDVEEAGGRSDTSDSETAKTEDTQLDASRSTVEEAKEETEVEVDDIRDPTDSTKEDKRENSAADKQSASHEAVEKTADSPKPSPKDENP